MAARGYVLGLSIVFPCWVCIMPAPELAFGLEDFAITEASCLTIRILQEFPDLRLPPGEPVVPLGQEKQEVTITLKPAEGCKVLVH